MAARTLRQRLVGGAGAQAFAQVTQLLVRLAEVPAFLTIWGATQYGKWLLIAAIPTYLSLADGGFATTSGREMTIMLSSGNRTGALRVFQSSWLLLTAISGAALGLIFLILFTTPLLDMVSVDATDVADVRLALILFSAYVLLGFQSGLYYGVFCAEHRYDLGTWISSSFVAVDLAASLTGAAVWHSFTGAAGGLLVSRLLLVACYWIVLRRMAPWCRLGLREASLSQLRQLVAPSLGSMAFPIGMAGNIAGVRILVGAVLGPAAVPVFSAMRTLARAGQMPTLFVIRILEPELAIAYGEGRMDVFRMLLRRSCQIAVWSGIAMTVAALIAGYLLFSWWVNGRFPLNTPTFLLLLLASALNGVWYTVLQVAYATNRTHQVALPFALIYGFGCMLLCWAAMQIFGLVGAGFSLVLVELAMCAITIPKALSLSGESWGNFVTSVARLPTREIIAVLRRR
jgi:O-antigen/teichoic acid export membrane protein